MDALPTELCIRILAELPISEAGLCALIRCSLLGKGTLYAAALSPVLWKPHYEHRYVHSDQSKEAQRRATFKEDWRQLFQERRRIDLEALTTLKALEGCSPRERAEHARRVVIRGLDVWDVLLEEKHRPLPPLFQKDEDIEKVKNGSPLTNLCRKYWASELLNIIARRNAIAGWIGLKKFMAGERIECVSLEEAYSALSSFHGILPSEIAAHIDRLTQLCKEHLDEKGICYVPDTEGFNVKGLCNSVCRYMRSRGYTRAGQMSFYDFRNSLPHLFLTTSTRSLPISLVFIFVGIMKRTGIEVSPLNTPNCVTALVRDTLVNVTQMPWEQDSTLGVVENYEEIKQVFDVPCQASLSVELLVRAARNITVAGAVEFGNEANEANYESLRGDDLFMWLQTKYLSQVILALFPDGSPESRARSIAPANHPRLFPLDMKLVVQDDLLSIFPSHATLDQKEDDEYFKEGSEGVKVLEQSDDIFVGRILLGTHCVIGWKKVDTGGVRCATMSFKSLHISEDTSPASFEATTCSIEEINNFRQNPLLGQFFDDAEFFEKSPGSGRGRGRFIMNKRLMSLYPDDDARGARWVREEET